MAMDFSHTPFFIRKMDTSGYVRPAEVPVSSIPLVGFLYVTDGEVLIDLDGSPFLCQPGQVLLIPSHCPFTVRYYKDAVCFTGGFAPSILTDSSALRFLSEPVHQGFWFDEAAFMAMLFNMLETAIKKEDWVFIEKGLDLFLSRIRPGRTASSHPAVNQFLEDVFNPQKQPGTIASYAARIGISQNYLSRLIKNTTGRSVGAWIDIVRIQKSKLLLSSTSLPIIDVAASVGIEDQSYFSRLFRKETGLTPTAFRKKMQA